MRNKDRQSQGLAYNDTDVYSPNVADDKQIASVQRATQGGRMRVKSSYYGPGIHSRISIRQNPVSKAGSTPLDTASQPCGPHIEQDNQALTEALGLASPLSDREILSPQSTVYPDDSLSIIDNERSCVNLGSCQAPMQYNTQASSLTPGASTKIGTLLMMDYGMDKDQNESNSRGQMAPSQRYSYDDDMLDVPSFGRGRSRTNDKPPRVPSPPQLPSLAQMAMEHANKEAYDNYRSVTYSIYGLYGESGKRYSVMYK
ncbi:hypothetical protein AMATHDRAFT_53170 [Amanita thiersii Skay4041]|uniref:Uncharacterized protein n=1 Tax=Amanita thiersii Skay4041 TaxID=703135 RepID=A0A2A9NZY1_9AGAR|nr:hypothetical protein AMATHDRAFT_53170 [Amanita thiersii Skay4041]